MATKKKRTKATPITETLNVTETSPENPPGNIVEALPPDLQAPINAKALSPQVRAKMVRYAFSARGWPAKEHPGTVRDFLTEHNIPIE